MFDSQVKSQPRLVYTHVGQYEGKPTSTPDKPSAAPDKPSAAPDKPSAAPDKPTSALYKPNSTTDKPTSALDKSHYPSSLPHEVTTSTLPTEKLFNTSYKEGRTFLAPVKNVNGNTKNVNSEQEAAKLKRSQSTTSTPSMVTLSTLQLHEKLRQQNSLTPSTRELPPQDRSKEPKQLDIGSSFTRKPHQLHGGPDVSSVLPRQGDSVDVANRGTDKDSVQTTVTPLFRRSIALYEETKADSASGTESTQKRQSSQGQIQRASMMGTSVTNATNAASVHSKTTLDMASPETTLPILRFTGSHLSGNTAPKQIYSQSSSPSSNNTLKQLKEPEKRMDEENRLSGDLPSSLLKPALASHATTITVGQSPKNHPNTPPASLSTALQSNISSGSTSNASRVLITASSQQESVRAGDAPATTSLSVLPSHDDSSSELSKSPRSILKNSVGVDENDSSTHINTSSPRAEKIVPSSLGSNTESRTEATPRRDSNVSAKESDLNRLKTNFGSSPPQSKRPVAAEAKSSSVKHNKQRRVNIKKSVTFSSEVKLHLDNQVSTVQSLAVDA